MKQRIPKRALFDIVREAREHGIGPRQLSRAIGYGHNHLSRIAIAMGMPPMPRLNSKTKELPDVLRQMISANYVDHKGVARKVAFCDHCGGTVRLQES